MTVVHKSDTHCLCIMFSNSTPIVSDI